MRYLFGFKPTKLHLGHLLSMQYVKNNIKNDNIYCLISDYGKLATQSDIKSNINLKNQNLHDTSSFFTKIYSQKDCFCFEYFDILMYVMSNINYSWINKVYNINYDNNENNSSWKAFYPIFMATDIIVMQPCTVILSEDQIHNVRIIKKIIRNISKNIINKIDVKFIIINHKVLLLNEVGKMSSSVKNVSGTIFLHDNKKIIDEKIKKAITQSDFVTKIEDMSKNTLNLYYIYSQIEGKTLEESIMNMKVNNYLQLKEKLAIKINNYLSNIKLNAEKNYNLNTINNTKNEVINIIKNNWKIILN